MSYTKHAWVTGETITAEKLNNIEDGVDDLNQQISGIEDSISDAYDATASYAVGAFCINDNTLYRCNTSIPTGGEAWTPDHWDAVQIADFLGSGGGDVTDVQINGMSILSDGVANIPIIQPNKYGMAKLGYGQGVFATTNGGVLYLDKASNDEIKNGVHDRRAIVPVNQHAAAFFGLAKAAGDTTQSASANAVGAYTEAAKSAIHEMLNGAVAVSGTTPTIVAKSGIRYVCGEVATLDFTPSATGICDVVFTSGATATVLTVPSTIKWANGFDPTSLEANTTYEINIMDRIGVAVGVSA